MPEPRNPTSTHAQPRPRRERELLFTQTSITYRKPKRSESRGVVITRRECARFIPRPMLIIVWPQETHLVALLLARSGPRFPLLAVA